MRILIIHTGYKVKGGEDSVVSNETNLLRSAGHEVELLLFSNAENTLLKILQLPFNYSSYKRTKEAIGIFKPDLVHIHNLHFGGSASVIYAVKKSNLPLVVTLHNYRILCPSGTLFYNGEQFMSSLNTIMPFKAIGKGVYQNSKLITLWLAVSGAINQVAKTWEIPDRYIVLGNNAKDMFLSSRYKHLAAKMEIKPNFCYEFKAEKKEDKGYYLYIGRLSPEKGIQVILNAFSKTDLSLKIVGSGPLEAEIISYANTHQQISFLGMKNKYEVYDLISSATAVIFSSLWHETFGMVIIEAFAGGTPVIASSIGEAKNLVNNKVNGLLFEAGNENDLFEKVLYYQNLTNEEKIKYRNNALKTYKENYTPEANLSQLMDIYQLAMKDKDTD
jgi:glycosyltransferase involved in cell wall biosynthesis